MNICQNLSFQSILLEVSLLSKVPKQCFVFGHFGLFSSTKLKNDWTHRLRKLPRKINILLTLTKKNWLKKNEWKLSNQSSEVLHASRYLTNCRKSFFFQLPYLEHDFIITNLVRLNFVVLKILETSQ